MERLLAAEAARLGHRVSGHRGGGRLPALCSRGRVAAAPQYGQFYAATLRRNARAPPVPRGPAPGGSRLLAKRPASSPGGSRPGFTRGSPGVRPGVDFPQYGPVTVPGAGSWQPGAPAPAGGRSAGGAGSGTCGGGGEVGPLPDVPPDVTGRADRTRLRRPNGSLRHGTARVGGTRGSADRGSDGPSGRLVRCAGTCVRSSHCQAATGASSRRSISAIRGGRTSGARFPN